jgi:iron complex outermembrane receptor protein
VSVLHFNTKLILVVLLLSSIALPLGGSESEEVIELDEFEVEGRELVEAEAVLAAGTDILDPSRSGKQAAGSLGEVLSWEAGVSSSFYGAAASRPILRGMSGYRVGVSDGGLSSGDLSASSPDHAVAIEPLFLRQISLHRGAAALLQGGSIGGAVDTAPDFIPSREDPKGWSGEAGRLYESVNEAHTSFLKGGHAGDKLAVRLNLLTREADDYAIPGLARTEDYDINNRLRLPPSVRGQVAPNSEGKVLNTGLTTFASGFGLGWFEPAWSGQVALQHYVSNYGVPLDGHTHGNPFGEPGVNVPGPQDGITIDLEQTRLLGQGEITVKGGWIDTVRFKGAMTDFQQSEFEGRFLSNDFQLDGFEFQGDVSKKWRQVHVFAGFEISRNEYWNRNISYAAGRADEDSLETSSTTQALYFLTEWELPSTSLRLGGRWDERSAERDDLVGFSRSDSVSGGVVEIAQKLVKGWEVVLSLADTARLANAEELYIEAPHGATGVFYLPNPILSEERAQSAELLFRGKAGPVELSASVYWREMDGFIFLENQGYEVDGLTAYALVQRDARFSGGELTAAWQHSLDSGGQLLIDLFADSVRATDLDRDQPLPRIPPVRVGGRMKWIHGPWRSSLGALHAMAQNRVPLEVFGTLAYQSPSSAYTLVTWQLERRFTLRSFEITTSFQVSNVLDDEARQHTSFLKDVAPLPGRSFQLSLQISW